MINSSSLCIVLNNKVLGRVKKFHLFTTDTNPDLSKWGVEFHQINPHNESERKIIKALGALSVNTEYSIPTLVVDLDESTLSERPYE